MTGSGVGSEAGSVAAKLCTGCSFLSSLSFGLS
jgi:hypothetical protein